MSTPEQLADDAREEAAEAAARLRRRCTCPGWYGHGPDCPVWDDPPRRARLPARPGTPRGAAR